MCRKLSEPIQLAPEVKQKITDALNCSNFRWRTAEGIAEEIKVSYELVFNFLFFSDRIISAGRTNNKGEQLFALREKYLKEIPTSVRILNAVTHQFH